jgi:ankyrin repeat protein
MNLENKMSKACLDRNSDEINNCIRDGVDIHYNKEKFLRIIVSRDANDIFDKLIEFGVNIHVNNEKPLVVAIKRINFYMINKLLKLGADINSALRQISDNQLVSLFLLACRQTQVSLVHKLLECCSKLYKNTTLTIFVREIGEYGNPSEKALIVACMDNNIDIVNTLFSYDIDIDRLVEFNDIDTSIKKMLINARNKYCIATFEKC